MASLKVVLVLVVMAAAAHAGLLGVGVGAPLAVTSQQSNILRSYGNLGQVSTYSKTVDTPYSSVSKSDVRVSNDAVGLGLAHLSYAGLGATYAY